MLPIVNSSCCMISTSTGSPPQLTRTGQTFANILLCSAAVPQAPAAQRPGLCKLRRAMHRTAPCLAAHVNRALVVSVVLLPLQVGEAAMSGAKN
jgi:hypothetical protein